MKKRTTLPDYSAVVPNAGKAKIKLAILLIGFLFAIIKLNAKISDKEDLTKNYHTKLCYSK